MAFGTGPLHSSLDLACEPSAVRYARVHTEDVLRTWGVRSDVADDALLVVAELATNAIRHAGGPTEPFSPEQGQPKVRMCAVLLWLQCSHLYVSVYDQDRRPPVLCNAAADAESGRGLQLVAGLSGGQWGYTLLSPGPGKFVWARLANPEITATEEASSAALQPVPGQGQVEHQSQSARRRSAVHA